MSFTCACISNFSYPTTHQEHWVFLLQGPLEIEETLEQLVVLATLDLLVALVQLANGDLRAQRVGCMIANHVLLRHWLDSNLNSCFLCTDVANCFLNVQDVQS